MPYSYGDFNDQVSDYIKQHFPAADTNILDVGAGAGKYSDILRRQYVNIDAVEVFKPNIDRFQLERRYRKVYHSDIDNLQYGNYDVIIMGDVMEHFDVAKAKRVLSYAFEHSKEVIIIVPWLYEQGSLEGNDYEIHQQPDLTKDVMEQRYPELALYLMNERLGFYVKKK